MDAPFFHVGGGRLDFVERNHRPKPNPCGGNSTPRRKAAKTQSWDKEISIRWWGADTHQPVPPIPEWKRIPFFCVFAPLRLCVKKSSASFRLKAAVEWPRKSTSGTKQRDKTKVTFRGRLTRRVKHSHATPSEFNPISLCLLCLLVAGSTAVCRITLRPICFVIGAPDGGLVSTPSSHEIVMTGAFEAGAESGVTNDDGGKAIDFAGYKPEKPAEIKWSERRDLNPRHSRWQRDALPTELRSRPKVVR